MGDIHGCGEELEELISRHPDKKLVSVGDLFDRAESGHKVWQLVKKHNIQATLGNHESKLSRFLTGSLEYLPKHYHWFLNDFIEKGEDLEELVKWIEGLPLLIDLGSCIVAHGGCSLEHPLIEDHSMNVYGGFQKRVAGVKRNWPELYEATVHSNLVVYGHVTYFQPLIKRNSIGIDTGVVVGGKLTSYCPEEKSFDFVPARANHFLKMEKLTVTPNPEVLKFRENKIRERLSQGKID